MEINEGLQVGRDELVERHHDKHDDDAHEPQRGLGKPDAIAPFEAGGQPVYGHAEGEEQEWPPVVAQYRGYDTEVPMATDLAHHERSSLPGYLVGLGRVEVGSAAEEESGE